MDEWMEKMTDEWQDSEVSDVGDGTFAVFLQGDADIGGGDVAFLATLLPRPRPAVAFVLLDDVQNLWWKEESVNDHTLLVVWDYFWL